MVRRRLAPPLLTWLSLSSLPALPTLTTLAAMASLPACHTRTPATDGGLDAPGGDTPAADVPGALALDFAATGCGGVDAGASHADGGVAPCTGTPPLTLTFTPVSSAALTRFRWTFGDGSPPSTDRAPTHTYLLPGTYDVAVVAEGAVGSVSRLRAQFVEVRPVSAGAPCDVDAQCGPGLSCLCGQGAPCGEAFMRGVCTSACPAAGCAGAEACARVDVPRAVSATSDPGPGTSDARSDGANDVADAGGGAPEAGADAGAASDGGDAGTRADTGSSPTPLCLAACAGDSDCSASLVCRALPGAASSSPWANVCVPPYFRRIGDSCRDAQGRLDDQLCASGFCADLGALGLCSASCASGAVCPMGTTCATFGDGRALCLSICSAIAPCVRDPLLGCETAGGGGALGFLTSPPAPTATFCAPRPCTSQADCSPSGTCKPLGVGAHCVAD
jgi:PKD repeat protein